MLGLFVNTLTADDKYSRKNWENFPQQIQMQISQTLKTFSGFLIDFLKSTSNSEHFGKKDKSHSLSIFEIVSSQRGGYLYV